MRSLPVFHDPLRSRLRGKCRANPLGRASSVHVGLCDRGPLLTVRWRAGLPERVSVEPGPDRGSVCPSATETVGRLFALVRALARGPRSPTPRPARSQPRQLAAVADLHPGGKAGSLSASLLSQFTLNTKDTPTPTPVLRPSSGNARVGPPANRIHTVSVRPMSTPTSGTMNGDPTDTSSEKSYTEISLETRP